MQLTLLDWRGTSQEKRKGPPLGHDDCAGWLQAEHDFAELMESVEAMRPAAGTPQPRTSGTMRVSWGHGPTGQPQQMHVRHSCRAAPASQQRFRQLCSRLLQEQ